MRTMALLTGAALIFAAGCSDDSGGKKDGSITSDTRTDSFKPDLGPDGELPPDSSPDQGEDGPRGDLPQQGDGAQPDTLADIPTDTAVDIPTDMAVDSPTDTAVDMPPVKPDTLQPDTFSGDAGALAAGRCATAPTVTLVNDTVTITDDIANYSDEFGGVSCPSTSSTTLQDGPQAYYKFQGVQDQWYRFTYNSESSNCIYFYVFTDPSCTQSAIEKDCQSGGQSGGGFTSSCSATSKRIYYYQAKANGMIYVAMDDTSAPSAGDGRFTLTIDAIKVPTNTTCANATQLNFFNGKTVVMGETHESFSPDEFSNVACKGSFTMDGPQVYYKFDAKANTTYKIKLDHLAGYYVYFYVFGNTCTEAAISADCSSGGTTGTYSGSSVAAGKSKEIIFTPQAAGTYHIAIDSGLSYYSGRFNLTVEEFVLPTNGKCTTADPITLVNGKATITGSTLGLTNEFGTSIMCSNSFTNYDGEQAYYKLTAKAGKAYKMTYAPTFTSYWYVFQAGSCGATTAMNNDCDSGGQAGDDYQSVYSSSPETQVFRPLTPGDYIIALDSNWAGTAGAFQLDIEEFDAPTNNTACNAQLLSFDSSGKATATGSTLAAPNEFGDTTSTGVTCDASTVYDGNQVYYEFTVDSTKGYTLKLTPQMSKTYMYVFSKGSCAARNGISLECGVHGWWVGPISAGQVGQLPISPSSSGQYVVAIDNSDAPPKGAGDYTLEISEVTKPTNDTCATAAPLTLTNGTVTVQSTTGFANNEYTGLTCKSGTVTSSPLNGPQLYWSLNLDATKNYAMTATTSFADGYLYVFDGSQACSQAAIGTDCQSGGATGVGKGVISNSSGSAYFKPSASGPFKIAVDSYGERGDVELKVVEFDPATNQTCAAVKTLTFTNGEAVESSFTIGTANEFAAGAIKCGGTQGFDGGQTYHKIALTAGKDYLMSLKADHASVLYVFRASSACNATDIDTDCASAGVSGAVSQLLGSGGGATGFIFSPTASGDYYVVVDTPTSADTGGFTLTVSETVAAKGLVFQEIDVGSPDYLVLRNNGAAPISTAGYYVMLWDDFDTFASPATTAPLPAVTLNAGQAAYFIETGYTPLAGEYSLGASIYFTTTSNFMAMLCDGLCKADGSNLVDMVVVGTGLPVPSGITFVGSVPKIPSDTTHSYQRNNYTAGPPFYATDWKVDLTTRP